MEESKDIVETPLLVLETSGLEKKSNNGNTPVPASSDPVKVFKRWINSLRSRRGFPPSDPQRYVEGWMEIPQADSDTGPKLSLTHEAQEKKWESWSNHSSHLETVKTTTISIASQSVVRSRGTTQSTTNQSIKSDLRESLESIRPALSSTIDEDAQNRAIKRRRVLRELVTTECDYVFGLKALADALFIFSVRPEIYYNVQQLRDIHEDFLARLRKLTPISNLAGAEFDNLVPQPTHKHLSALELGFKALHSKSLRSRSFKASVNSRLRALAAETREALEVAQAVGKLSRNFSTYKLFCSSYGLLSFDVELLRSSVPNWRIFDLGIEALSKSVASIDRQAHEEHRSMALDDLLIKPVQRLCKYPLLLEELLRWTHIQDDPSAHDGIRQILESVRRVVQEVNQVNNNPINRILVLKTRELQNLLDFPEGNKTLDLYKQLGPLILCGVLHVTYSSPTEIVGCFMVCVLFSSHILFANMNDDNRRLRALMCLHIPDLKIDTPHTGEDICCECVFSWKLVFQDSNKRYELLLSASSATEEKKWTTETLKCAALSTKGQRDILERSRRYAFISLDLVPLSSTELPLARRPSMQALSASRPPPEYPIIVIKRTHCPYLLEEHNPQNGESERFKEHPDDIVTPIIARRQDRIRLERAISAVYTRDALPYPGMTLAMGDLLFRPGSIMRRNINRKQILRRRASFVNVKATRAAAASVKTEIRPLKSDYRKLEKSNGSNVIQTPKAIRPEPNDQKGPCPSSDSKETIRRARTFKMTGTPKSTPSPDSLLTKKETAQKTPEISTMKPSTIRRMLNSMSTRKPKKNERKRVGSGAS
ncbi:putative Rho guanyl nucleotide exchange factor [Aspergillus saccharolyticus JOP 1030-1]|uniref:Rho guanyl nucleotide exchange factor n=1 Tax=Aspergillus saccharolyticus JOP 1030-1 TaxID=1450539 RepID=A0A319A464_9EURO|nr:rho guanyl nucleotide exchange factor [Aspergillus saccharolyticus JOP 1030-1]PYH46918.1 rho guanyl nucleotide exchange factor [Aspergillus saccharolyticus JOP 1030-1]